jgi:hypothetical protein
MSASPVTIRQHRGKDKRADTTTSSRTRSGALPSWALDSVLALHSVAQRRSVKPCPLFKIGKALGRTCRSADAPSRTNWLDASDPHWPCRSIRALARDEASSTRRGISHARNLRLRSLWQAPTDGGASDRGCSRAPIPKSGIFVRSALNSTFSPFWTRRPRQSWSGETSDPIH